MNKLFSTLALAATFAGSASAYSYTTPGVGGALTAYDMQPTYSLEALYGIADKSADPNMYGARLGFSLYNNAESDIRHQFGVYLAGMWGSESYKAGTAAVDIDTDLYPLTLGYDLNIMLSDNFMLDLGVKAGYAFGKMSATAADSTSGIKVKDDIEGGGFTYSIGAAIKYAASDAVQIKLGYEYSRSYIEGDYYDIPYDYIYGAHVISLGASVTF